MPDSDISKEIELDPGAPNYDLDPREVSHFFDLDTGDLIVGDEAYQDVIDRGANPVAIHSLGVLLIDRTIEIDPDHYQQLSGRRWALSLYLKYGRWLHRLTTPEDTGRTNLTATVVDRACSLGVGPSRAALTREKRFGSMQGFYEQLELDPPRFTYTAYDDWPHELFVNHVVDTLRTKRDGQRLEDALKERFRKRDGPSLAFIVTKAGALHDLLDERGYATHTGKMRKIDFVDRGAMFMAANAGLIPQTKHFRHLASDESRRRSHSVRPIEINFDKLTNYQAAAERRYPKLMQAMEHNQKRFLMLLRGSGQTSRQFIDLASTENIPLWMRLRVSAQYLFIRQLKPYLPESEKIKIATLVRQHDYLNTLFGLVDPDMIDQLRSMARERGLKDDIWPRHNPELLQLYAAPEFLIDHEARGRLYLTKHGIQSKPMPT